MKKNYILIFYLIFLVKFWKDTLPEKKVCLVLFPHQKEYFCSTYKYNTVTLLLSTKEIIYFNTFFLNYPLSFYLKYYDIISGVVILLNLKTKPPQKYAIFLAFKTDCFIIIKTIGY